MANNIRLSKDGVTTTSLGKITVNGINVTKVNVNGQMVWDEYPTWSNSFLVAAGGFRFGADVSGNLYRALDGGAAKYSGAWRSVSRNTGFSGDSSTTWYGMGLHIGVGGFGIAQYFGTTNAPTAAMINLMSYVIYNPSTMSFSGTANVIYYQYGAGAIDKLGNFNTAGGLIRSYYNKVNSAWASLI